ncbi:hypothetical protein QJS10_CPB04g01263 [Acorus calamus]|uniref:Uncharacterized protein n=1 Tax=Acorus calamus TaxID=4465 RepID=A0AAV9EXR7_ACOCL|nr:hypothetical protein QJS10_CPB04g01263 [Acorus calamus]
MDPESLKPKPPRWKDLKPYPIICYLDYKGHTGSMVSISVSMTGQWIASGSKDGTVQIWEDETGRCLRVWEVDEAVKHVSWNPEPDLPILAVCVVFPKLNGIAKETILPQLCLVDVKFLGVNGYRCV